MGAVVGGLLSFFLGLLLIVLIAGILWEVFIRVILPLGLIILLIVGICWVYEKFSLPENPPIQEEIVLPSEEIIIAPLQEKI